ncbi:6668_t:CDS:2 [Diversispora eburnea]|uniref:6668_t:CDS:1 n=1 Tax=Diversispora eburnea TaxID=1213867 RepID=A0A9N9BIK1_9GLOM|nr:6668_t:CDS:2 [Diversispora eburnea]
MHKSSLDNPALNTSTTTSATGQDRSAAQRRPIISGPQQTPATLQPGVMQQTTNVSMQAIRPNLQASNAQQNTNPMQQMNLNFPPNQDHIIQGQHSMVFTNNRIAIPNASPRITRHSQASVLKHNSPQAQPIISNSGTIGLQNVSGISMNLTTSARTPQGGVMQTASTPSQVTSLINNPIYGAHTDANANIPYRNLVTSPNIASRPPPIGMHVNQQSTFETISNAPSIQHFNSPILQQQNTSLMLQPTRTTVTNDLQSNQSRPVRPNMPLSLSPVTLQDNVSQQRQSVSITPSSNPSQPIMQNAAQTVSHSTIRSSTAASPTVQQVSGHLSHRNVQKGNVSPSISSKSLLKTPLYSHTSSRSSHKISKLSHKPTQNISNLSPQDLEAAQAAADAANVLVMSSRQRADPQRSMNIDHNVINQYSELNGNNNSLNKVENSQRNMRFVGNLPMDYSTSNIINDETKEEIGLTPHNRGHKMKNRAAALDSGVRLRAPYGYQEDLGLVDIPNGSRRHIIYRINKSEVENMTEFYGEAIDNPYKDIDVKEILSPLKKPEDAVRKSDYLHILKNQHLEYSAIILRNKIEKENIYRRNMVKLMDTLQGDDVMYQDLDFRLNPPQETVSTRVIKAEEVEGGLGFGVLNVGLQGSDRSKGKLAQETKDQGLEVLIHVRNQLQVQLECSNEVLRSYTQIREAVLGVIRRRNQVYKKIREIDKQRRIEEGRENERERTEAYSGQGK